MIQEILQVAAALKSDSAFAGWRILVGEDKSNPLTENDAPFLVLNPGPDPVDDRDDRDHDEIQIAIDWGIKEDTIETLDNIPALKGFEQIEQQKNAIRRVICSTLDVDWFTQFDFTVDNSLFPLFMGGITFTAQLNTTM